MSDLEVRPLNGHAEFAQAVELQRAVWQFEELELLPVRLFVVAEKVGGQALGAFKNGCLIGFCLAIPGIRDGEVYLHSHMLGVLPEFRNAGAGRALKLAQRDDALARGFKLIEWTFDPLELKNAHFNIERLGAIVPRYVLNQYGSTTSPLHGGLPTDRCTAQWWIRSRRVEAAVTQHPLPPVPVAGQVSVPADIDEIKQRDPNRAREIQSRVSREFQEMLSKGWAATGFERTSEAGVYVFGPWPSE
ncbi:MAG TPA: GNAT family N-acetyltransferase [Bryobacteraceae bacterium]|nr:GNAT family N-acetyltransferase [Bryobacteraceae bacterium]